MTKSVFIDLSFPDEPPTPKLPFFGAIDEVDNFPDFFVLKIGGYQLQLKRSVCFVYILAVQIPDGCSETLCIFISK